MIRDMTAIQRMAKEAYRLNPEQVNQKLSAMIGWPSDRTATRIIGIPEAMERLVKVELAELVYIGFVLMVEIDQKILYPVRTFDFMTGLDSESHVTIAKSDIEFLRTLKGSNAPLDSTRDL